MPEQDLGGNMVSFESVKSFGNIHFISEFCIMGDCICKSACSLCFDRLTCAELITVK